MKVSDLIEHLQQLPADAEVVLRIDAPWYPLLVVCELDDNRVGLEA